MAHTKPSSTSSKPTWRDIASPLLTGRSYTIAVKSYLAWRFVCALLLTALLSVTAYEGYNLAAQTTVWVGWPASSGQATPLNRGNAAWFAKNVSSGITLAQIAPVLPDRWGLRLVDANWTCPWNPACKAWRRDGWLIWRATQLFPGFHWHPVAGGQTFNVFDLLQMLGGALLLAAVPLFLGLMDIRTWKNWQHDELARIQDAKDDRDLGPG
jgi:hypothetical protein